MTSELAERIADAVYEAERDYIDSGLPIEKLTAIVEGVLAEHGDVSIRANLRYRNEIERLRQYIKDRVQCLCQTEDGAYHACERCMALEEGNDSSGAD